MLCCVLFTTAIIGGLLYYSYRLNSRPNSFIRLLPSGILKPEKIINLKYNSYYIAGQTRENIYLGNINSPFLVISVNLASGDTLKNLINTAKAKQLMQGAHLSVDSPYVYLKEGRMPILMYGKLNDLSLLSLPLDFYFTASLSLSPNSHVFRVIDRELERNILVKSSGGTVTKKIDILTKQVDGVFCTDGKLIGDRTLNKLVYIYNYRNQFICMDTNLKVLYKGKTIDTVTRVKFKIDTIKSEGKITTDSPLQFVNKNACTDDGLLFIQSGLRADNDVELYYENASAIDVYALKDGKYLFSFYLPNYGRKKARDFRVKGDQLVALYERDLFSFKIHLPEKLLKK